jgi:hypothetical protein
MRLLSRTVGADRVVDELHMSFKHSQAMPWILPGIPATNKQVEVVVVSIVSIRGGKLSSEHVYWDQASVLLQVGLLDPKLVSEGMKGQGVQRLPVTGREAARRVLDGVDGKPLNELVPEWTAGVDQKEDTLEDEASEEEQEAIEEELSEEKEESNKEERERGEETSDGVKAGSDGELETHEEEMNPSGEQEPLNADETEEEKQEGEDAEVGEGDEKTTIREKNTKLEDK